MTIPSLPDSAYEPTFAGPSALEQLMLEIINRARANPQAEVSRIGTSSGALATGASTVAVQPLAPVLELDTAAQGHSDAMIDRDFFAHTDPLTGLTAFQRMAQEGYARYFLAGENIGFIGASSGAETTARIEAHHRNLWESDGHQVNLLRAGFSEIGLGLAVGDYQGWPQSTMVTQKFGDRGFTWLTGVVIEDADGDAFYDLGEGLGGVRITAWNGEGDAVAGSTFAAGGYAIRLDPGTWHVRFEGGSLLQTYETEVTIGPDNVKVDLIRSVSGAVSSPQSDPLPDIGPTTLPASVAEYLAADGFVFGTSSNDTMSGTSETDQLNGGMGRDTLRGLMGDDFLSGGGGRDRIFGGGGDDVIAGNRGHDRLIGGAGADVFLFRMGDGNDQIDDFQAGLDILAFGGLSTDWRLVDNSEVVGGNLVVTAGDVTVTLLGVTDPLAVDYGFLGEAA